MYQLLGGKAKKLEMMSKLDCDVHDRRSLGMTHLSLLSLIDFNIFKEKTKEDFMVSLSRLYEKPLASNKIFLIKWSLNMKMSECKDVVEHLNEFNTVTS